METIKDNLKTKNADELLRSFIYEEILTGSETALLLNVTRAQVSHLTKAGKLKYVKATPNGYIFLKSDVLKYKYRKRSSQDNTYIVEKLKDIVNASETDQNYDYVIEKLKNVIAVLESDM